MLETRKSPRRKMVLPVKVSIDEITHLAHTQLTSRIAGHGWGSSNAIATRNDRKSAARVAQSEISNRMDSAARPE